jgi:hypothetical protein
VAPAVSAAAKDRGVDQVNRGRGDFESRRAHHGRRNRHGAHRMRVPVIGTWGLLTGMICLGVATYLFLTSSSALIPDASRRRWWATVPTGFA